MRIDRPANRAPNLNYQYIEVRWGWILIKSAQFTEKTIRYSYREGRECRCLYKGSNTWRQIEKTLNSKTWCFTRRTIYGNREIGLLLSPHWEFKNFGLWENLGVGHRKFPFRCPTPTFSHTLSDFLRVRVNINPADSSVGQNAQLKHHKFQSSTDGYKLYNEETNLQDGTDRSIMVIGVHILPLGRENTKKFETLKVYSTHVLRVFQIKFAYNLCSLKN